MTSEKLLQLVGSGLCAGLVGAIGFWYSRPSRIRKRVVRIGVRLLLVVLVVGPVFAVGFDDAPEEAQERLERQNAEAAKRAAELAAARKREVPESTAELEAASEVRTGCMQSCAPSLGLDSAGCARFCNCQLEQLKAGKSAVEAVAWVNAHTAADGTQDEALTRRGREAGEHCLREIGYTTASPGAAEALGK